LISFEKSGENEKPLTLLENFKVLHVFPDYDDNFPARLIPDVFMLYVYTVLVLL
jgi:hypothetical protein